MAPLGAVERGEGRAVSSTTAVVCGSVVAIVQWNGDRGLRGREVKPASTPTITPVCIH